MSLSNTRGQNSSSTISMLNEPNPHLAFSFCPVSSPSRTSFSLSYVTARAPGPETSKVRKRARSVTPRDGGFPTARPAPGSVAGVDAAITARAFTVLPKIIHRDLNTLSYGSIARANAALAQARHHAEIIEIFDIVNAVEAIRIRFTPRLFVDLFHALMKIGGKSSAKKGYQIWRKLVATNENVTLMSPRAYNFLFVLQSRAGFIDEAMEIRTSCVENGYYLNKYSHNVFLNACAKANRPDDAFGTLRHMAESNVHPDIISFNVLISCCVRNGDIELALGMLRRMHDWGVAPDNYSYNSVINGLRKNEMLYEAFNLVAIMERGSTKGHRERVITDILEELPGALLPSDSPRRQSRQQPRAPKVNKQRVEALLEDLASSHMLHIAREGQAYQSKELNHFEDAPPVHTTVFEDTHIIDGEDERSEKMVKPDLVTYNTLLSGIASQDNVDIDLAFRVKTHIESKGIKCNEVTYNSLMGMAARQSQVDKAFELYEEMTARGLVPNCECFTTLITMCGRARLMTRAFEVHDHMEASGMKPTVITYNALLMACRCCGGDDACKAVLTIMQTMRETPQCHPDVITYSTVIDTLGRSGRLTEIGSVLDDMAKDGIEPNLVTYTSVIASLTRARDLDGALRVLGDMENHGIEPNVYTFSSLIHGAGRTGQYERAFDILEMMRERDIVPSLVTYMTLIQLAAKSGDDDVLQDLMGHLNQDDRLYGTSQMDTIEGIVADHEMLSLKNRKRSFEIIAEALGQVVPRPEDKSIGIRKGELV